MTDSTEGGAGAAAANQGQTGGQPPLVVNAQYVKDLSFENPNAPQSLLPSQQPPQVGVNVDVQVRPVAEGMFEVALRLRAEAKQGEAAIFIVELSYGGLFTLNNVPEQHQRPLLLIEGPRLLFPFARAIIADATRDGGFPPLMIAPIDFVELYRRQIPQTEAKGEEDAKAEKKKK